MKKPSCIAILGLLVCVLIACFSCSDVEDEKLEAYSNKVATIRIVAQDTIFTTNIKTRTLKVFTEFLDGFGNVVNLEDAPTQELYINGQRSQDATIDTSEETEYSVYVKVGNRKSNTLIIKVVDLNHNTFISKIEVNMGDSTFAPYAIAGLSEVDFSVKIYDYQGKEFKGNNYPKFTFWLDGRAYSDLKRIPIERAGTLLFHAESGEHKTEVKTLVSRSLPDFTKIYELPIIFHVVSYKDGTAQLFNQPASEIHELLSSTNEFFSNRPPSSYRRSHNSVIPGIQLTLANTDTLGHKLEEAGIHRILTDIREFPYEDEDTYKFTFEHMWNPDKYVNVFILNVVGTGGFAFYPPSYPDKDNIRPLTYSYAAVIKTNSTSFTLAHELGHFLGLPHIFTQNETDLCEDGDGFLDTESYLKTGDIRVASAPVYCDEHPFYSTNIMDYVGGFNSFTLDQAIRMRDVIERNVYLPDIGSSARITEAPFRKGKLDLTVKPIN